MASGHEHDVEYGEIDMVQLLRTLYARKWTIVSVTLLAGILAALYSLTKSNVYESTAALIVREPQQAIERAEDEPARQELPTLSVETLQTLTESTEITWTLFENLLAQGALAPEDGQPRDKQMQFQSFQRGLSTALRKQQQRSGSSVELLPILLLKARGTSPEEAQLIANEWARLVEAKSREIYKTGVEAMGDFIGDMYRQSNDSLVKLETGLATKELEAGLQLKESRLETLYTKISELEDAILEIDIELAVDKVAIEGAEARIEEQQIQDEWVGTAAENALLKDEPYDFDPSGLTPQSQKIVRFVEQKVSQMEALREYRREQNLLGKEKRFEHSQTDLERILAEKAKVDDELPAKETAIGTLTKELSEIPETIVLRKAITDDALWSLHVEENAKNGEMHTPLQTETLNPLFQSVRETIVDLTSEAETLRGSTVQLEQSEKVISETIEELENEIDIIKAELTRREAALEATTTSLQQLREAYLEERKTAEELRLNSLKKEAERETRNQLLETLTEESTNLESSISGFKLEIDALTREVEKTKNVRMALATKAEEAALLGVSVENATRTGTAILFEAQASPDKVAPARKKLVLVAAMVAALVCIFIISISGIIRESPATE